MKVKIFRALSTVSSFPTPALLTSLFVAFSLSGNGAANGAVELRGKSEQKVASSPRPTSAPLASSRLRREIASELRELIRESIDRPNDSAPTSAPTSAQSQAQSVVPTKNQTVKKTPDTLSTGHAKKAERKDNTTSSELAVTSPKKAKMEKALTKVSGVTSPTTNLNPDVPKLTTLRPFQNSKIQLSNASETPLIFDIPVTYNERVRSWIRYFQTTGHSSFRRYLERSSRYMPLLQYELTQANLPQDLVYVAMIESGFNSNAESHAGAMGMWQFIAPTGKRYGLKIDWWIDERRDFHKATGAAIRYMTDLNRQFGSWYLVAASYNMGENGVRRLIARHKTNNFWELAEKEALPKETRDYVPKIIAAVLISKAPALYGFRDLEYQMPLSYEYSNVPGGTELARLADHLGVSEKYLKDLNPELLKGYVPKGIRTHKIRVPKGSVMTVSRFVGTIDPSLN